MHGGGAMRSASLLHYLAARYSVDAVLFQEEGQCDPLRALPEDLVRDAFVLKLPAHSRAMLPRTARNLQRLLRGAVPLVDRFSGYEADLARWLQGRHYDLAVVEHCWCAGYAEALRPHAALLALDLHNVESTLLARSARSEGGLAELALNRFARLCDSFERRWLPMYDLLLATSRDDERLIHGVAPGIRTLVYPNALPWRDALNAAKDGSIVFSGNFAYPPNRSGVRWFREGVWPRLREKFPELRWRLLGKGTETVRNWTGGDERIEITNPGDDAIAWIARSAAAIVPLESGSGTRVKILEAWAAGVPVVSTALGAEGLPAMDRDNCLIGDTPKEFGEAVERLLAAPELAAQIGCAGRRLYEERFTWPVAWGVLARVGL
jgi:glycosyltransferase involved in cell wall biosynthesis